MTITTRKTLYFKFGVVLPVGTYKAERHPHGAMVNKYGSLWLAVSEKDFVQVA